jgi:hypothetical protein
MKPGSRNPTKCEMPNCKRDVVGVGRFAIRAGQKHLCVLHLAEADKKQRDKVVKTTELQNERIIEAHMRANRKWGNIIFDRELSFSEKLDKIDETR